MDWIQSFVIFDMRALCLSVRVPGC